MSRFVRLLASLAAVAGVALLAPVASAWAVSADLALTKTSSPNPVMAGSEQTFTITITNNGPDAAANVQLDDFRTAGVGFVSATSTQGTCAETSPQGVRCNIGTMANGAVVTVTIVVRPQPGVPTFSGNDASVTSSTPDPNPANNRVFVVGSVVLAPPAVSSDLHITDFFDFPDAVAAGSDVNYVVGLATNGPDRAENVGVRFTLPPGVTFVGGASGCAADVTGTIVTCGPYGTLFPPGAIGVPVGTSVQIAVRTSVPGPISVTATATSSTPDPNPANNTQVETTSVLQPETNPPTCVVVFGANQIRVSISDVSGVASVRVISPTTNVAISPSPDADDFVFAPPSPPTSPVVVTAARRIRTRPMVLNLRVRDALGNETTCDPVLSTFSVRRAGAPAVQTFTGLPRVESKVTVKALTPGVEKVVLEANGRRFTVHMRGRSVRRLRIASALRHFGRNTVRVKVYGNVGARALVAITD